MLMITPQVVSCSLLTFVDEDNGTSVRDCLLAKHPSGQPLVPSEVFSTEVFSDSPHPVIFEPLSGALIKSIAMSAKGAARTLWC